MRIGSDMGKLLMHVIKFTNKIYTCSTYYPAQRGPGTTLGKNCDFKIGRDHGKKSFERRVYELVDDKSLSWDISQKSTQNRIQVV